jgi:formylglycine-generating enzyme required for sulfatase activity
VVSLITLEGIEQAINGLNYSNKSVPKHRLVHLIRQFHTNESLTEAAEGIATDELVKKLWDIGDDYESIRKKRKNFSCVKSSLNADLQKLYREGKNPEGIIIGPDNYFTMSGEAKDNVLEKFGFASKPDGDTSLAEIMAVLQMVRESLADRTDLEDAASANTLDKIDQLADIIKGVTEMAGSAGSQDKEHDFDEASGRPDDSDLQDVSETDDSEEVEEVVELAEEDILEEVVDADLEEGAEDYEEVEEVAELAEDDILEEVEELAADDILEEVEEDELVDAGEEAEFGGSLEVGDNEFEEDGAADDFEGVEEEHEPEEVGLPEDSLGLEDSDGERAKIDTDQLLAEQFDGFLGSMDRYYNQYIIIPEGEYIIGNGNGKIDARSEQKVRLAPFYIGQYPVINGLFEIFIEKTGYKTFAEKIGYGTVYYGRFQKARDERTGVITSTWNASLHCENVEGACWYQPSGPGSTLHSKRTHPVVQITREDAMAFAAWTGKRLPTEVEWEAAARAAGGWIYPWGPDWRNDSCNLEESCMGDTTPVDQYVEFKNDFGIVDVMGNVMEWTSDGLETISKKANESRYYIAKGGSWVSGNDIKLFDRSKLEPETHSNILGFRCVAH